MTREDVIADLKKRAAKERSIAREYRKMPKIIAAIQEGRVATWADECDAESDFFLTVARMLEHQG